AVELEGRVLQRAHYLEPEPLVELQHVRAEAPPEARVRDSGHAEGRGLQVRPLDGHNAGPTPPDRIALIGSCPRTAWGGRWGPVEESALSAPALVSTGSYPPPAARGEVGGGPVVE